MEGILVDVAVGIATSVIGGMILAALGIGRPSAGLGAVGCAVGIVSLVVGVLLGVVVFRTVAEPMGLILAPGSAGGSPPLAILMAGALSVGLGVITMVVMYQRMMSQL